MSLLGMVDLVTIVPVFVALSTEPIVKSPTGFVRLYRVLMLARVRRSACELPLSDTDFRGQYVQSSTNARKDGRKRPERILASAFFSKFSK